MYDKEITKRQLAKAEELLGWKLIRHTVDEVDTNNQWFTELVDDKGNLTRKLTREEDRYIQNERTLCRWDYRYWLTHYHKILTWQGNKIIHMFPNIAQKIVLDAVAEMERKGIAIKIQNLKARQLGITTEGIARVGHRVQFHSNVKAITGSADPDKSEKMFNKMVLSWQNQPWFLMPSITTQRVGELIEFGGIGSSLSVQHGNQARSDVGRGETPTVAMLSEVSEWMNPLDDIESSLLKAMHEHPTMMLQLESTAMMMNDYWHKLWKENKANWGMPDKVAKLQPVFLPWFIGSDIYPTKTWLKAHPVPENWQPSGVTVKHAEKAKQYVANVKILRHYLRDGWEMPLEQMWYWENEREDARVHGTLNTFYREMPADDQEAFQSQHYSVFDAELLASYHSATQKPKTVFGLEGPVEEIRPELRPNRAFIDENKKPINIDGKYQLVPLKITEWPDPHPEGKIMVWDWPKAQTVYGIGADTSQGIGQDRSTFEVMQKATVDSVARQVCEFHSSLVNATDLVPFLHCAARMYTVMVDGERRQPLLAIETNNGGDACQFGMRKLGWSNFYKWIRYDRANIDPGKATMLGTVTSGWSRELILSWLIAALRDCVIDVNSPYFVDEMRSFVKDENKQRMAAAYGSHDDLIMPMAWIYLALHILDGNTEFRSPFGRSKIMLDEPPVIVPQYATFEQNIPQAQRAVALDIANDMCWPESGKQWPTRPTSPLESSEIPEYLMKEYESWIHR